MKNINCLPKFLIFGILIYLTVNTVQAQYVTIEGKQFKDENDSNFYPVCMNYLLSFANTPDSTDYFVLPHVHYGASRLCDCSNQTDCYGKIEHDFERIHEMGFNTVHLVGLAPTADSTSDTMGIFVRTINNDTIWQNMYSAKHYLTSPYTSDTFIQLLFGWIDSVIIKAHSYNLKVILDCQVTDNFGLPTSNVSANISEYISALSNHIHNSSDTIIKQTFMAYILGGEPAWSDTTGRTKQDVCNISSAWYDTLKTNDPDHLVASAGMQIFELFRWDPAVIKMDFYFPHFYPYFYTYENINDSVHNQAEPLKRVYGSFYWLSKNCPVPWMVAETGLSADSTYSDYRVGGIYIDQANYVDSTLHQVRDCGGSGYTVWQYQEVWWDDPENGAEDRYGILMHGDQYSIPVTDTSLEKPAVTKFRYFNPNAQLNPCNQPSNYYDPDNWEYYSPNFPKTLTGTITETGTTNPIEDAYIVEFTWYKKPPPDTTTYYSLTHIFSHSDGSYSLNPSFPNSSDAGYSFIGVTASGAEVQWFDKTYLNSPWQYNFSLKYIPFKYDLVISNETVTAGNNRNFQGWSTLTASDITVQNGAVSEFKARDGVTINGDFTAALGSEVYIYCTETFPECNTYSGMRIMNTNNSASGDTLVSDLGFDKQIDVKFIPVNKYAFLDVYPNPGNGVFTLNLRTNKENNTQMQINIYDITGSCIYKGTINENISNLNLSFLSKGIYYLHASTKDDSFNQKLIIK